MYGRRKFSWWIVLIMFAVAFWVFGGCVSARTIPGELTPTPCIGVIDGDAPQPNVTYRVSVRNVILATVFSPLVVPPVVVLLDKTKCPVARSVP